MAAIRPYCQNVPIAASVTNGPVLPFKLICDAAARIVEPAVRASRSIVIDRMTALRDIAAIQRNRTECRDLDETPRLQLHRFYT